MILLQGNGRTELKFAFACENGANRVIQDLIEKRDFASFEEDRPGVAFELDIFDVKRFRRCRIPQSTIVRVRIRHRRARLGNTGQRSQ